VIRQGEIYWLDLGEPNGSGPGYLRPYVVIQNDVMNHSRIATAVVCGITSSLRRATSPGNVLLDEGEGGLPRRSVVNVSQLYTVDKSALTDMIGSLSSHRVRQIVSGICELIEPAELR